MKRILLIAVVAISLIACNAQSNRINTQEFIEMASSDSVKVIDVRSPGEVAGGYISEADYFIDVNSSDFSEKTASLDKNVTYIVYCRSGVRSSNAIKYMKEQGFTKLYDLSGGIMSWEEPELITK